MTDYTDDDRDDFLTALDKSDVTVSGWEAGFLETSLTSDWSAYTDKQRVVIDRMIEKYGGRVQW